MSTERGARFPLGQVRFHRSGSPRPQFCYNCVRLPCRTIDVVETLCLFTLSFLRCLDSAVRLQHRSLFKHVGSADEVAGNRWRLAHGPGESMVQAVDHVMLSAPERKCIIIFFPDRSNDEFGISDCHQRVQQTSVQR